MITLALCGSSASTRTGTSSRCRQARSARISMLRSRLNIFVLVLFGIQYEAFEIAEPVED